ncbi:MAG TPA: septum formation initiator family protein [Solirubrobacteraceae bacterium]|jgi:cell division protein FtsB|nr:septum formation initiator family protein [Solirubrobacteraceae bacterium]
MNRRSASAPGVRWDRVGRIMMLVVLVVLVYLAVGPVRSLISTYHAAQQHRAEISRLERENAQLRLRRAALHSPVTLEREARKLGMIRPGERAYVIDGLPAN